MNLLKYLKDVKNEAFHVKWPTSKVTFYFSLAIVAISIVTAVYLGFFDYIFSETVKSYLIG